MASSGRGRQLNSPYQLFSNIFERVTNWEDLYDATADNPKTQELWRKQAVARIQSEILTNDEFPLYSDGSSYDDRTSKTNMEKIAMRFLTFYSMISITALSLHSGGIFASANGLIAEFTSGIGTPSSSSNRSAAVKRGSFDMKKIESKIACWKSWALVYAEGRQRINLTRVPATDYYSNCLTSECRAWFQSLILHTTSMYQMFVSNIMTNKCCPNPIHASSILEDTRPTYENGRVTGINYEVNMQTLNFFREHLWIPIIDEILTMGHGIYDEWIRTLPEEEIIRPCKVSRARQQTSYKRYMRTADRHPGESDILLALFSTNEIVINAWANIVSKLFHIILHYEAGPLSEMRNERFQSIYSLPIRTFLLSILDMMISTSIAYNRYRPAASNDIPVWNALRTAEVRNEWVNAVIQQVAANPVRHLNPEEIEALLRNEQVTVNCNESQFIPPPPPPPPPRTDNEIEDDIQPGHTDEDIIEIDATSRVIQEEVQAEREQPTNLDNVTVLIVEDPPPGCLDEGSKCKSCGIDWSKLHGRVQILRCPSGTNRGNLTRAVNAAIGSLQERVRTEVRGFQNGGQDEEDRQVQVNLPATGNTNESVNIDSSFQNGVLQVPISIISPLHTGQASQGQPPQIDPRQLMAAVPDLVANLFARLLHGHAGRRTFNQVSEGTRNPTGLIEAPPPIEGPTEVQVNLIQEQVQSGRSEPNGDETPPTEQLKLQVCRRSLLPIITNEVIDEALDTVGLGNTNSNPVPAFSMIQSVRDDPEIQRQEEVDYNPSHDHVEFILDGKDATSPDFSLLGLICYWAMTGKFEHSNLEDINVWHRRCLQYNSGPLIHNKHNNSRYNLRYPSYLNVAEYIGTNNMLAAYSIYETFQKAINHNQSWNSRNFLHRAIPIAESRLENNIRRIRFRQQIDNRQSRTYATYDVVIGHIYAQFPDYNVREGVIRHDQGLVPLERFLGMVLEATVDPDENDANILLLNVEVMVIQVNQPTREENENQSRKRRRQELELDAPNTFISLNVEGYIGTEIRNADYLRNIDNTPSICRVSAYEQNIILNTEPVGRRYNKIPPFWETNNPSEEQVRTYIRNSQLPPWQKSYIRSLMNLNNVNVPSAQRNVWAGINDLPRPLNPSQLTAVVEVSKRLQDKVSLRAFQNGNQFDSNLCSIIGPAGTGKTRTICNIIATFLNSRHSSPSIVSMYDYIESSKNANHEPHVLNHPTSLPEDNVRVLILTETNDALNSLEEQINEGFMIQVPVQDADQDGIQNGDEENEDAPVQLRRIIPLYTRVSLKHERRDPAEYEQGQGQNPRHVRNNESYQAPRGLRETISTGTITLSAFGSIRKAFADQMVNRSRLRTSRPQYDLVLIDEASQAGIHQTISTFCHLNHQCTRKNYLIVTAGDPFQQPPVFPGAPSAFKDLATTSILDVIIPSSSIYSRGKDLCDSIMLNTQYRMHPTISALSNMIARRNVSDSEIEGARHVTERRCGIFNDNMSKTLHEGADLDVFRYPIVWIDPYRSPTGSLHRVLTEQQDQQGTGKSSVHEAAAAINLIESLVDQGLFRVNQITLISPYNAQVNMIRNVLRLRQVQRLRSSHPFIERTQDLSEITLRVFATIQGGENDCVIIMPGRHLNERLSRSERSRKRTLGIAGFTNSIYVAVTRTRQQLFFIGDYNYLSQYPVWKDVTYFLNKFPFDTRR